MNTGKLVMETDQRFGAKDRRSGSDRRTWQNGYDFPFIDSHGVLVTEERRISGDRRLQLDTTGRSPDASPDNTA